MIMVSPARSLMSPRRQPNAPPSMKTGLQSSSSKLQVGGEKQPTPQPTPKGIHQVGFGSKEPPVRPAARKPETRPLEIGISPSLSPHGRPGSSEAGSGLATIQKKPSRPFGSRIGSKQAPLVPDSKPGVNLRDKSEDSAVSEPEASRKLGLTVMLLAHKKNLKRGLRGPKILRPAGGRDPVNQLLQRQNCAARRSMYRFVREAKEDDARRASLAEDPPASEAAPREKEKVSFKSQAKYILKGIRAEHSARTLFMADKDMDVDALRRKKTVQHARLSLAQQKLAMGFVRITFYRAAHSVVESVRLTRLTKNLGIQAIDSPKPSEAILNVAYTTLAVAQVANDRTAFARLSMFVDQAKVSAKEEHKEADNLLSDLKACLDKIQECQEFANERLRELQDLEASLAKRESRARAPKRRTLPVADSDSVPPTPKVMTPPSPKGSGSPGGARSPRPPKTPPSGRRGTPMRPTFKAHTVQIVRPRSEDSTGGSTLGARARHTIASTNRAASLPEDVMRVKEARATVSDLRWVMRALHSHQQSFKSLLLAAASQNLSDDTAASEELFSEKVRQSQEPPEENTRAAALWREAAHVFSARAVFGRSMKQFESCVDAIDTTEFLQKQILKKFGTPAHVDHEEEDEAQSLASSKESEESDSDGSSEAGEYSLPEAAGEHFPPEFSMQLPLMMAGSGPAGNSSRRAADERDDSRTTKQVVVFGAGARGFGASGLTNNNNNKHNNNNKNNNNNIITVSSPSPRLVPPRQPHAATSGSDTEKDSRRPPLPEAPSMGSGRRLAPPTPSPPPAASSTWHPGASSSQRDSAFDSSRKQRPVQKRFSNSAADGSAADAGASGLQMQGGPVASSIWHPGASSSQRDSAFDSSRKQRPVQRRFSNSAADGSAADAGASSLQMQGGPVASPTWHPGALLSSQRAPARASQLPSLSLSQARMFLASGMIDLKLVRPSVSGFTVPLAAKRAPSDQSETESRRMSFELASQQLDGLRGLFGDTDSSATEGEDEGGALGGGALMREPESSGVSRALITTPERLDLAIAGSKVGAGLADQVQPEDRGTRKGSNQDRKSDRSQSHSKKKQRVTSKDGSAETPFWAWSSIDFADESLEDSQSMDEDNIAARDKLLVDMKEALLDAEEERTLWRTQVRLLLSLEPRMAPGPAEMSFKLSLEWRDAQVRKLFHDITKLEVKQRLARRVARQQRGMARILRKSIQDSQNSCLFSGRSGLKAESSVITDCTSVTFGSLAADSLTAGSSYMPEASQEQKNKRAHKGRPKPRVLGTRLDTLLDEKSAMCHVKTKRPLHPKAPRQSCCCCCCCCCYCCYCCCC
ncbi:unnamed protein product [Polarella glacialis]|uniref:Uncharacterized protein n=1 Tax=Polarella glacialis TaxID=89957 RepID=A0A813G212_POLGL|nr:unnamed protein product [Polarella glacialis]